MQRVKIDRVISPTFVKWIVALFLNFYIIVFFYLRFFELMAMLAINPLDRVMVALILIPSLSLIFSSPVLMSGLAKRCGLIIIVIVSLKFEMDDTLQQKPNFRPYPENMMGYVSIVTDAHSNIGTATSQLFFHHGATVIMTCPTLRLCEESAEFIKLSAPNHKLSHLSRGSLVSMLMDYNDLNSVYTFSQSIKSNYSYINHLILNTNTYQHTYPSFGRNIIMYFLNNKKNEKNIAVEDNTTILQIESENMQLSKFALVKWLLSLLLLQPPSPSLPSSSSVADSAMCSPTELVCSNNNITNNLETEFAASSSSSLLLPPSRIAYIGSSAYISGSFPSSFFHDYGYIKGMISSVLGSTNISSLNTSNPLNNEESNSNNSSKNKSANDNDNKSHSNHGRASLALILQAHELQTRIDKYVYLQSLCGNLGVSSGSLTDFFNMPNNRINSSTSSCTESIHSSDLNQSIRYRQVITSVISTGNVAITNSNHHVNVPYQNNDSHNSYYEGVLNAISNCIINFVYSLTSSTTSTATPSLWVTSVMTTIVNSLFLRTADQVAYLVLYALCSNNYLPGSYIDAIGKSHDLLNYRDNGFIDIHLKAFFGTDSHQNNTQQQQAETTALAGDDAQRSSNKRVAFDTSSNEFEDRSQLSPSAPNTNSSTPADSINDDCTNSSSNIVNNTTTFYSPCHSSSPLPLYARTPSLTYLSYDIYYFQQQMKFCYDCRGISKLTKSISATEVSNRLWKVCNGVLEQFEKMAD